MRHFMIVCAALSIALFSQPPAHAKSKSKAAANKSPRAQFSGQLLSYGQLMRLSAQKRKAYMKDVAALLVEMEKIQNKYTPAEYAALMEIKEQFASLMQMMAILPEAEAQTAGSAGRRRADLVPRWDSRQKEWICRGDKIAFDPTLGTCAYHSGGTAISPDAGIFTKAKGSCSAQTMVEVEVGGGVKCIPNTSWEALSRQRQNELRNGIFLTEKFWKDHKGVASSTPYTLGAGRHNIDGTLKDAPDAPPAAAAPAPGPVASPGGGTTVPLPVIKPTEIPPTAATPVQDLGPNVTAQDGGPFETIKPVDPVYPSSPAEPAKPSKPAVVPPIAATPPPTPDVPAPADQQDSTQGEDPAPPAKPTPACEPPSFKCEALSQAERAELIRKFRLNKDAKTCISGGFFTNTKAKRSASAPVCEVVREYKYRDGVASKCSGANKALCNPTVFCLGLRVDEKLNEIAKDPSLAALAKKINRAATEESTKEKFILLNLCVDSSQNITRDCQAALDDHLSGKVSTFGTNRGESYIACDAASAKNLPMENEWHSLRENVKKFYDTHCTKSTLADFKRLFCAECQTLADRMMAMNQRAGRDACATETPVAPAAGGGAGSPEAIREGI